MPIETLICAHDDHKWQRERRRGVKPKWCPDHKSPSKGDSISGQPIPHGNSLMPPSGLSEPLSVVSDEALELLTGGDDIEPERRRKLEYICDQLERGRKDEHDVTMLKAIRDREVELHFRNRR